MSDLWVPPEYRKTPEGRSAPGQVETFVYYQRADGWMIIPPRNDLPTPKGYDRIECKTVADVERASKKFAAQKQLEFDRGDVNFHMRQEKRLGEIKDKLLQRMKSVDCGPFEKDFIRESLKRIEADRNKHKLKRELYLHMEAHEAPLK